MSSKEVAIRVNNLGKCYQIYDRAHDRLAQIIVGGRRKAGREFWALREVSFDVRHGETVGILGRNGSGKSTLLQMVCGTLSPTIGDVEIYGRIAALLELGSGFHPDFTGRENIFMNGQILGLSHKEIENKLQSIINFAAIDSFIDQPVKTYSSGMAVRLAFSIAINSNPDILVVDEALSVGDIGFQVRCFKKIGELQKNGCTILVVSHSPSTITQLCDRAIVLHEGKLVADCEPYRAIKTYTKLSSFEGYEDQLISVGDSAAGEGLAISDRVEHAPNANPSVLGLKNEMDSLFPYWDEVLYKAVSPVVESVHGVILNEVRIEDEEGKSVNVIPQNATVSLCFSVVFSKKITSCRFAWTLRSIEGFILGGGATHPSGEGEEYPAGAFHVKSYFCNVFVAGEYIIDICIRGGGYNNNSYLLSLNDAIVYRSFLQSPNIWRNGVVNCLKNNGFQVSNNKGYLQQFN